jgi:undecaprenyl-phosphate galactose phosphotransferase
LAALLPDWPMMALLFVLVRRDGGPGHFGHTRIGYRGHHFTCWKLRTMAPNAGERLKELLQNDPSAREEWEKDHKLRNDPRITKLGKFIRVSVLDELPQLLNVFKGEMSVVGPRRIVDDEVQRYGDKAFEYFAVRPGITGLWQVSGRNDVDYDERVTFDEWYVKNWSLWLDLIILMQTVTAVLARRGAY